MIKRKELQELRKRCWDLAHVKGTNEFWVSAYLKLAEAADYLDAMNARSEEPKEVRK